MLSSGQLPLVLCLLTCSYRPHGSAITVNDSTAAPDGTAVDTSADVEVLIQLQTDMRANPLELGRSMDTSENTGSGTAEELDATLNETLTTLKPEDAEAVLNAASKELEEATPEPFVSFNKTNWSKEIWKIWEGVSTTSRHRRKPMETLAGVCEFFESALVYEWFIFIVAMALFVPLQYFLLSKQVPHGTSLLIWIALGIVYNFLIAFRGGGQDAIAWFTGYLLEMVFSIENVFVFHVVVKAFRIPEENLTQRAIFTVIICQIVFEMVFFMGLAQPLRAFGLLPYILGVWLIYVGVWAAREQHTEETKLQDTWAYKASSAIFGQRLLNEYDSQASWLLTKDGLTYVSMLLPATCCLLLVDFFLEVDVTITKIEELQNQYIAFTSSAVSAFSLIALFFVAGDLFQRFQFLQYGISFVLVFFGAQMLLHSVLFVSPLASCGVIILVMVFCIALSHYVGAGNKEEEHVSENSS